MTDNKVTIKRYRTYNYYPYKVFEAEVEINDKYIYANMNVRDRQKITLDEIYKSDCAWWYDAPLTEIDNFDDHYTELMDEELEAIFGLMVQLWNKNPVLIDDENKWVYL